MRHRLWMPPRLHGQSGEHTRKVTWLELFSDLVYVAVMIQVGNSLSENVSLSGFVGFALVFASIWWAWSGLTFFMNRFIVDDVWHRNLVFLQILAVAWLGISVEGAFSDLSTQFALSYAALRLVIVLMYVRAYKHTPATRPLTRRYIVTFTIGAVLWLISAFVPAPYNYVLWTLALVVNVAHVFTPRTRELHSLLPPDSHHMMERYGIFTLIVLGESFIKTISAASGMPIALIPLLFSFFGIGVVFGLWWLYFDDTDDSKIRATSLATSIWIYVHLPLAAGLTAFGVAAKKLFVDAGTGHTKPQYLVLFCVAMILYGLSVAAIDWVSEAGHGVLNQRTRILFRMGMAAAFALLAFFGSELSPLVFIFIAAAILTVQIFAEALAAWQSSKPAAAAVDG